MRTVTLVAGHEGCRVIRGPLPYGMLPAGMLRYPYRMLPYGMLPYRMLRYRYRCRLRIDLRP